MFSASQSEKISSSYIANEKHLARWDLFRSCVKTDTDLLAKKEDPFYIDDIVDMIYEENKKREYADDLYEKYLGRQRENAVNKRAEPTKP